MQILERSDPSPSKDMKVRLLDQAVSSIEKADSFSDPFPHIFFRDFFPPDIYETMVNSVPEDGFRRLNQDGTRMALRIYGDHVEKVDSEVRELWMALSSTLQSSEIEKALRVKLHEGLEIRARGDRMSGPDNLSMVAKPVVYRDLDGYGIKPHPDTRKKVVTMQLYCPVDDAQSDLGTTLYRASLKGLANLRSYGLEPVKTLPFLPNVGYAFVVLKPYHSLRRMSWHGRPKIEAVIDRPRVSILNTFYSEASLGF